MAKNVTSGRPVPADAIRAQIHAILTAWGMSDEHAATTAEVMVETDLRGVDSHGLSMLMTYEQGVQAGRLKMRRSRSVLRDTGPTALLDAGTGSAIRCRLAMNMAVDKACSWHRRGRRGEQPPFRRGRRLCPDRRGARRHRHGDGSRAGVTMVPTRGAMPVMGTNPLAFAAPAGATRRSCSTWRRPPSPRAR